jgi:hypothetical protein
MELFPEDPEEERTVHQTILHGLARGIDKIKILNFGSEGRLVEVAPGVVAAEVDIEGDTLHAILRLKMAANGMFRPYLGVSQDRMPLEQVCNLLPYSRRVIRQLMDAGFVKGDQPTADRIYVSLPSLFAHIRQCSLGPNKEPFWTPANRKRYEDARV